MISIVKKIECLFCFDGEIFPKQVVTATLNYEINTLKDALTNITVNEELFDLEIERAFVSIYKTTFPEDYSDNDYRYDVSPTSFSDIGCFAFAVSNGHQTRIMAAKLNYIISDSKHDLNSLKISEAIISNDELHEIVLKLEDQAALLLL